MKPAKKGCSQFAEMNQKRPLRARFELKEGAGRDRLRGLLSPFFDECRGGEDLLITDQEDLAISAEQTGLYVIGVRAGSDAYFQGARMVLADAGDADPDAILRAVLRHKGMPVRVLETDRLLVRESLPDDYEALQRITGDLFPEEDRDRFLAYIRTVYDFWDFGLWTVTEKETGELVGRCGLTLASGREDSDGRVELAYAVRKDRRGRGYGTEVCRAIVKEAFGRLDLAQIYAVIESDNHPSQALAQRLGFRCLEGIGGGRKRRLWVLERAGWTE